jgi:glycosyltransferase involved in cell wall biosynthesis
MYVAETAAAFEPRAPMMKVTVVMTTYNHENFIAESITSALSQDVTFDYEIVVIEDCSTDRTRDIVINLRDRYPERIRLVLAPRNRNDSRNFAHAIETSGSQYIAWLEGDDYWTSPHKLQRQVDFLDARPNFSACFHNVSMVREAGNHPPEHMNPPDQGDVSTVEEILATNSIATCSVMFRRGLFGRFPEWYFELPFGDWPVHILNVERGRIGYLPEVMGAWRIHSAGLWSRRSETDKLATVIGFYERMNVNLGLKYDGLFRAQISRRLHVLANTHMWQGEYDEARKCAWRLLTAPGAGVTVPRRSSLRLWLEVSARAWLARYPRLYRLAKRLYSRGR